MKRGSLVATQRTNLIGIVRSIFSHPFGDNDRIAVSFMGNLDIEHVFLKSDLDILCP